MCSKELLSYLERLSLRDTPIVEDEYTSRLNQVTERARVPRRDAPHDTPWQEEEYLDTLSQAEVNLSATLRLIDRLCNGINNGERYPIQFVRNSSVSVLLVAYEYDDSCYCWSNEVLSKIATNIKEKAFAVCLSKSMKQVDQTDNSETKATDNLRCGSLDADYLKLMLQNFSEGFTKSTWKLYPARQHAYSSILKELDHSNLGELLSYLLPPALFITDDWETRNKVFGLSCLHHITKNTAGSELRWYGRGAVVFGAMQPLLYCREEAVVAALYPPLLLAATALHQDPANTPAETPYDMIMEHLLNEMTGEQKLGLRYLYSNFLVDIISAMGILSLRWEKELLEVWRDYLSTYDGDKAQGRRNALRSVRVYVQECWPQVHRCVGDLMAIMVTLLYDVTEEGSTIAPQAGEDVVAMVVDIAGQLCGAAPGTMREVCQGLDAVPVHPKCQAALTKIHQCVMAAQLT